MEGKLDFINKKKVWIVLVVILIFLGILIIDTSFPSIVTIVDATTKEPIEGLPVYYSINGFVPTPGGEVGISLKNGVMRTNGKGRITIPFHININPFVYGVHKEVIINNPGLYWGDERNSFYKSASWMKVSGINTLVALERNQATFDDLNKLLRINTTYGFCHRYLNWISSIQQVVTKTNLNRIYLSPKLRDISFNQIEDIGTNCFIINTDTPIFKINADISTVGNPVYARVVHFLYINGSLYDTSKTKLNEIAIRDHGYFLFTTDILINATKITYGDWIQKIMKQNEVITKKCEGNELYDKYINMPIKLLESNKGLPEGWDIKRVTSTESESQYDVFDTLTVELEGPGFVEFQVHQLENDKEASDLIQYDDKYSDEHLFGNYTKLKYPQIDTENCLFKFAEFTKEDGELFEDFSAFCHQKNIFIGYHGRSKVGEGLNNFYIISKIIDAKLKRCVPS